MNSLNAEIGTYDPSTRSVPIIASTTNKVEGVALKKWDLSRFQKNPVILWAHDASKLPVGLARNVEFSPESGLTMRVVFGSALANPLAEQLAQCVHEGLVRAVSVGYTEGPNGVAILDEVSFVSIGLDEDAGTPHISQNHPANAGVIRDLTGEEDAPRAGELAATRSIIGGDKTDDEQRKSREMDDEEDVSSEEIERALSNAARTLDYLRKRFQRAQLNGGCSRTDALERFDRDLQCIRVEDPNLLPVDLDAIPRGRVRLDAKPYVVEEHSADSIVQHTFGSKKEAHAAAMAMRTTNSGVYMHEKGSPFLGQNKTEPGVEKTVKVASIGETHARLGEAFRATSAAHEKVGNTKQAKETAVLADKHATLGRAFAQNAEMAKITATKPAPEPKLTPIKGDKLGNAMAKNAEKAAAKASYAYDPKNLQPATQAMLAKFKADVAKSQKPVAPKAPETAKPVAVPKPVSAGGMKPGEWYHQHAGGDIWFRAGEVQKNGGMAGTQVDWTKRNPTAKSSSVPATFQPLWKGATNLPPEVKAVGEAHPSAKKTSTSGASGGSSKESGSGSSKESGGGGGHDVSGQSRDDHGRWDGEIRCDDNGDLHHFDFMSLDPSVRLDGKLERVVRTQLGGVTVPARLSRTGVLKYRNPDGTIRRELRLASEIFKADSLRTLEHAPVIDIVDHTQMVTPSTFRRVNLGHAINIRQDGNYIVGDLIIQDQGTLDAIERGERTEISCGYRCTLDMTPGVYEGEPYDCVQRDIRYNHAALCPPNRGRAGPEVGLRL